MATEPYIVVVDSDGCSACNDGKTWTVVGPDDVAIGMSFLVKEEAEDLARYMNEGYWCGARAGFKAGFVAHPEAEAPTFTWSFDPETCSAGDREPHAWQAWSAQRSSEGVEL